MRTLDQLLDTTEPALRLVEQWVSESAQPCEILPPSERRAEVLLQLQVTTRSPLGALAYETGGVLIQNGWLRVLGSGHDRLKRDLWSWNQGHPAGFLLVADDVVGGFFALNGGALGPDLQMAYYLAPDDLEWLPLGVGFAELFYWFLSPKLDEFYEALRWPAWESELPSISGDECVSFFPFLWTKEGSLASSHRARVPVSEAFELRLQVLGQ